MVCVSTRPMSVTRSKVTAGPSAQEEIRREPRQPGRRARPGGSSTRPGIQLRAPWAASIAGILFAVLFTAALLLLRTSPIVGAGDAELVRIFATGEDVTLFLAGLYLVPFAGIMFLWFIAVIRDQLGEREDRFFATVFFGSGLLFIALVFVAGARGVHVCRRDPLPGLRRSHPAGRGHDPVAVLCAAVRVRDPGRGGVPALDRDARAPQPHLPPLVRDQRLPGRRAAVRWSSPSGTGSCCLVPAWVALVSVFILVRERGRSRAAGAPTT